VAAGAMHKHMVVPFPMLSEKFCRELRWWRYKRNCISDHKHMPANENVRALIFLGGLA